MAALLPEVTLARAFKAPVECPISGAQGRVARSGFVVAASFVVLCSMDGPLLEGGKGAKLRARASPPYFYQRCGRSVLL